MNKRNFLGEAIPQELFFVGRAGDPRIGEWVETEIPKGASAFESVVILGTPDDLGVKKNLGRVGAKEGPNSIRKYFYRMAMPMDLEWEKFLKLSDAGNTPVGDAIGKTHAEAQRLAFEIARLGHTLIAMGGGHDVAAPHFMGFVRGRRSLKVDERVALVNIDPHLDVRELEGDEPHSGSPFRQLLESRVIEGKGLVEFGARSNRNARSHFEFVKRHQGVVIPWEAIQKGREPVGDLFQREIDRLAKGHDVVGVTVDLDSCSEAEGTSAAPVIGFSARELVELAMVAGRERKVRFFEVAEVSPPLDPTERSSRIAAELIYAFLRERALFLGAHPLLHER